MRFVVTWISLAGLALACEPPTSPKTTGCLELPHRQGVEVARIGDRALTVDEIAENVRDQGSSAVRRYSDPKRMREFIEDQVRIELLVAAAFERGLDRDPEVIDAARKVMVRKLLLEDLGKSGEDVAPGEILRYYDKHREDYLQPEKRRIAEILLPPNEEGRALASSIIAQLQGSGDDAAYFRQTAMKHSLDASTRRRGGEVPFAMHDELEQKNGPSYATSVFSAETGLIAEPVQSTRGWHVVRVLAIRDALDRDLDEVRSEIRQKLQRGSRSKLFEEYLAGLKKRHPIAIYEQRIDEAIAALSGETGSDRSKPAGSKDDNP